MLYWVLLYVAAQHSKFKGSLTFKLFDEVSQDKNDTIGRIYSGGKSKKIWLSASQALFLCMELESTLECCRHFFKTYTMMVSGAVGNEVKTQELDEFKENAQVHILKLKSFFDDVLDNDDCWWKDSRAHGASPRHKGPRNEEKEITKSINSAICKGAWPGAYGYKRPVPTSVVGLSEDAEVPETGAVLTGEDEPEIAGPSELANIPEENGDAVGEAEAIEPSQAIQPVVKVPRRRRARVVEKSDRVLRSHTQQ